MAEVAAIPFTNAATTVAAQGIVGFLRFFFPFAFSVVDAG